MSAHVSHAGLFWLLAILAASPAASAQETQESRGETSIRIALLVGNNRGDEGSSLLRYSQMDVGKMRDVLTSPGGFRRERIHILLGEDGGSLRRTMAEVGEEVAESSRQGKVLLFFYFSGHSKNGQMEMNGDLVPFFEVKNWLKESPAEFRIAVVDSCDSVAFIEAKGGTYQPDAPPLPDGEPPLEVAGMAVLTSSSRGQKSHEGSRVSGSFFTHYLVSALRGAADGNGDFRVTLEEAYAYAHKWTTRDFGDKQTPRRLQSLEGTGPLVLSQIAGTEPILRFGPDLAGEFYLFCPPTGMLGGVNKGKNEECYLAAPASNCEVFSRDGNPVDIEQEVWHHARIDFARERKQVLTNSILVKHKGRLPWLARPRNTVALDTFLARSVGLLSMEPLFDKMEYMPQGGVSYRRRLESVVLKAAISFGKALIEPNEDDFRYWANVITVEGGPMWLIDLAAVDLLLGATLGTKLVIQKRLDTPSPDPAWANTFLAGIVAGIDLKMFSPLSVLVTWELDGDLVPYDDVTGRWLYELSLRAGLSVGYRY